MPRLRNLTLAIGGLALGMLAAPLLAGPDAASVERQPVAFATIGPSEPDDVFDLALIPADVQSRDRLPIETALVAPSVRSLATRLDREVAVPFRPDHRPVPAPAERSSASYASLGSLIGSKLIELEPDG